LIVVWAVANSDDFRNVGNLSNLSRQMTVLGLVAIAQFVVVIAGGVDLSIGANVRLSAIVGAIVMDGDESRFVVGVLAALGVGLAVGAANAFVVTRLRVEPFIATLGTGALVSGLALYIATTPVGRSSPQLDSLYGWSIGPLYFAVLLLIVVWIIATYALQRTPWGRHVYAVGGDPAVARLSGIDVPKVTASTYLAGGFLGGLAAIVLLASAGIGDAALAVGLEFDSLAVVVIGGASLAGGRGRLIGALGGVVLFSLLGNVFNLLQIDVWYQQLVRGLIILIAAAALVDRHRQLKTQSQLAPPKEDKPQFERSA
jgi:ribose transport system permease protein